MKESNGMFSIKLQELDQQYQRLQSRLRLCQQNSHTKIQEELEKAVNEYRENEALLQKNVEGCRSQAVAALAEAQLQYFQTSEMILEQKLPDYLHSETGTTLENKVEAAALYAEYAIDFAVRSMRYALIAALKAIDAQMNAEETENPLPD